jgi:ABC-type sugar transport system ATPase subunit
MQNIEGAQNAEMPHPAMEKRVIYKIQGICKWYPGTIALDDINFELYEGEIHGLVGKNGAGKSTFTGIMFGSIQPTAGQTFVFDNRVERLTPWKAKKLGIFLVPQITEFSLDLSIAENMFLGSFPLKFGWLIDRSLILKKTAEIIEKLDLKLSPSTPMGRVSLEDRQLLQVGKGFWVENAKIVLLDEVTATLSLKTRKKFFEILRSVVKQDRKTIVLITHRLEEVLELCDRVTVFRNGIRVATEELVNVDAKKLAELITGKDESENNTSRTGNLPQKTAQSTNDSYLSIRGLDRATQFENVSLEVSQGEVVGIAGLEGCGAASLMRCIVGISPADRGEIFLQGQRLVLRNPREAAAHGIVYLPGNREEEGLFNGLSVEHNIIGGSCVRFTNKLGFIKDQEIHDAVGKMTRLLNIVMSSAKAPIDTLSGGNKQKVVIGRLLNAEPNVYLMDHVTQGVDIEAKGEILRIIRQQLAISSTVIMSSESIQEMMEVCDRIIVMYKGRIIKVFPREDYKEEDIFTTMQGLGDGK